MVKFSRRLLERVAVQMNDVMGLNPAIDMKGPDDDTLFDTICWEATGRGKIADAIRADDFVSDKSDKKLFDADALKFFADAGVWDADKKMAVIGKKDAATAPAAPAEEPEPEETGGEGEKEPAEEPAAAAAEPQAPPQKPEKKASKKKAPAAPAKKAEQAPAAQKEETVAKKSAAKKGAQKTKKETAAVDQYGFREGSTTSKAVAFLATGKHTMADAKKKFGSTFYSAFKKMGAAGHKVKSNEDGTFSVSSKK